MNSKTFARLMLLLPLIMFIGSVGYMIVYDTFPNQTVLETVNSSWSSFATYWIIPYSFLAIYLLAWSRKKTVEEIRETFSLAPIMLMFLAGAGYLLVALYMAAVNENALLGGGAGVFMLAAITSVPASLIGGYIVVGVSILIHKLFKKLRLIND